MVHPKQPPDEGDRSPTGEDAALERIGRLLGARLGPPPPGELWSGDDAAVVGGGGPGPAQLLLSTDALVGGVHADLALVTLADVGWKALTAAVSDIAAMGGRPTHALVSLCAPPGTDLDALAEGLAEAATRWACPLVGGDLSGADQLVLAVAVTGVLDGEGPAVSRRGARGGHALFVTGPLGRSAAGLRVLRTPDAGSAELGAQVATDLAVAYRRPDARIAEGRTARAAGASAMMDLSDGIGLDLHRLADASAVGFVLHAIPVAEGAREAEARSGGEDYELLMATPDERALLGAFADEGLPAPIRIGTCTEDPGVRLLGGKPLNRSGYQHAF